MFKKATFDLGVFVCPIAIKYNKIFVDAFWNSKRESFSMHLVGFSLGKTGEFLQQAHLFTMHTKHMDCVSVCISKKNLLLFPMDFVFL